jgi:O-antigen/teichoic acid export membrane protein
LSTARRVLKNFASLTFADLFCKALAFLGVVYLARVLGAEGFGRIEFAQAIVVFFLLAANQGITTFGSREIAKEKGDIKTYANHILAMRLLLALISYVFLVVFTLLVGQPAEVKNLLLLYGLALFTFSLTLDWIFQGIEKMEYVALGRMISQMVYVGGLFLLVRSSVQILRVPIINIAAAMFGAVLLLSIFIKSYGDIKLRYDRDLWKRILKQSIPMGVSFILIKIYYTFDTVMLGFIKGEEVVGWYNATYKVVLLFISFANLFGSAIFPVLSRSYKESPSQFQRFVFQFSRVTILIGLPIAVGGTILGGQIIRFVYGPIYQPSIIPLQILIWSVFTVYLNCSFAFSLLACDRQKEYMYSVLAGALINLALNFALIPKYGMIGAGIATITCEVVVLVLILFYSMKVVNIFPGIHLLKVCGASVFMGLVVFLLQGGLPLRIFVGILVYLIGIVSLGGIRKEDLAWAKQIMKAPHD